MSSIPNSPLVGEQLPATPAITPSMIQSLRQTKPWVRFLSVLGFFFTGIIVLFGIFLALGAGMMGSIASTPLAGVPLVLFGLLYLAIGILYIIPNVFLFRYANGIQKALGTEPVNGIEIALRNQKSFWKFVGIFALIVLIIQAVVLVLVVIIGIAGLVGTHTLQR